MTWPMRCSCLLFLLGGCDGASVGVPDRASPEVAAKGGGRAPSNILVVLIDDLAAHQVRAYGVRPQQPAMPTLWNLGAAGTRFENAYAFASCSPARAALLTGRYPSRSGTGNAMESDLEHFNMPLAEVTIPEMLKASPHGYSTALIGKWHLNSFDYPGAAFAPNDQGFDWYSGTLENLPKSLTNEPSTDYFHWERVRNGKTEIVDGYATTVTTDEVLERTQVMPEPWFVMAAYNAPHVPLHVPPAGLHSQDLAPNSNCTGEDAGKCFNAAVEAFDTELGRLLDSIDPDVLARTTVIVTSDNGTPEHGIFPPFDPDRDKGTLTDGGVQVPFIVSGPQVTRPGIPSQAFVSIVDIFATVADIAGVDTASLTGWDGNPLVLDSVNFNRMLDRPEGTPLPPRHKYVYSELFYDNGAPPYHIRTQMIRMYDSKLIQFVDGTNELYRYVPNAIDEGPNLTADGVPEEHYLDADLGELTIELDELNRELKYEGP